MEANARNMRYSKERKLLWIAMIAYVLKKISNEIKLKDAAHNTRFFQEATQAQDYAA